MTTTNPTAAAPATAQAGASRTVSQAASTKLAENFDNFLKLLTTQLQFQDPLEPMDSNQFTQQLVSFTGVEQAIATNRNLELLLSNAQTDALATASNYIGRSVIAEDNQTPLTADGARWTLNIASESAGTKLTIRNASGAIVAERPGPMTRGDHTVVWDGRDDVGNQMPPGIYRLEVSARSRLDQPVRTAVSVNGLVEAVELSNGSAKLLVGGTPINITQIRSVGLPPSPQDAAQ
jgi:flagellar basal-body rod modification protein FlgD